MNVLLDWRFVILLDTSQQIENNCIWVTKSQSANVDWDFVCIKLCFINMTSVYQNRTYVV